MDPVDLVGLRPLMARTPGSRSVVVGVIDGRVALGHPAFAGHAVRELGPAAGPGRCGRADVCCAHGTAVAGILAGEGGVAPGCTLLSRPLFTDHPTDDGPATCLSGVRTGELARALTEIVDAGAHIVNLSMAQPAPSGVRDPALQAALDRAADRGVILVVAAGNQGRVGSSVLTDHPWAVPVIAYDRAGHPMPRSNLAASIGRHGVGAPGDRIPGPGPDGHSFLLSGTSAAAPFVAGAFALLRSAFPHATPAAVRYAVTHGPGPRRSVTPPLLDAWAAYRALRGPGGVRSR
ncbi:S8 family peptidase [Streptomyces scabiei]|uniref:S8 family peptidase n=1 Tax=Streptomyces scabiei TaxID=1930 RepID=UPI0007748925|nr:MULTISPECIES: S8 family serine peptidase [Streptomyces]MBP5932064.1 S8 family serine peptidase [Streptomyces sp. LBUM 1479]MBP5894133.1 S8 family serine peptidase [Streptomyces sp. LBUM 1481]MBP5924394.1 S8 family serine peptidase [Streptomyces sp. LBUM 1483]MDX2688302.1 S8 family serine peptidase [Streptomyces scabiei]MDX2753416.1 S8 family serine peptidase [Streptomyces scabiei]